MHSYVDEFPLLPLFGLYASDIRGDGNCLFNALSDQVFGSQKHHAEIRSQVIQHMRDNASYYKQFLEVYPGGGTRRNPKRKNAGTYTSTQAQAPSPADVDRVFEEHITRMSKGGTWGDNMEIQAFAAAYDSNVKIYQRDFAYIIPAPGGSERPVQHIAYHTWEHYSSIRNVDGPHEGLPNVNPKPLSPALEEEHQKIVNSVPTIPEYKIELLSQASRETNRATLIRFLEESNGIVDDAFEKMFGNDERRSVSSQQSSSVEREPDSGDESGVGPNKRQDRRLSRASKSTFKSTPHHRHRQIFAQHEKFGDSLESLINAPAKLPNSTGGDNSVLKPDGEPGDEREFEDDGDTTSQDWDVPGLKDGDTSSGSDYASSPPPSKPDITIKVSPSQNEPHSSPAAGPKLSSPGGKKVVPVREKKSMQKQAQKKAAKERKQLIATGRRKSSLSSVVSASTNNTLHPGSATSAMRTLYI